MAGRYRMRTKLRRRLPAVLITLLPKGKTDCGEHDWYNADGQVEHCYHCTVGVRSYDPNHFSDEIKRLN